MGTTLVTTFGKVVGKPESVCIPRVVVAGSSVVTTVAVKAKVVVVGKNVVAVIGTMWEIGLGSTSAVNVSMTAYSRV